MQQEACDLCMEVLEGKSVDNGRSDAMGISGETQRAERFNQQGNLTRDVYNLTPRLL